jgi:DNA-directed RNA polymerase specialized sigma24 family protein
MATEEQALYRKKIIEKIDRSVDLWKKTGDQQYFVEVYDEVKAHERANAVRGFGYDNAEDGLHDAFVRTMGSYDPGKGSFLPYYERVLNNLAIDRWRRMDNGRGYKFRASAKKVDVVVQEMVSEGAARGVHDVARRAGVSYETAYYLTDGNLVVIPCSVDLNRESAEGMKTPDGEIITGLVSEFDEDGMVAKDELARVLSKLREYKTQDPNVISRLLYFALGADLAETAEVFGVTEACLKTEIHRARLFLKEAFDKDKKKPSKKG